MKALFKSHNLIGDALYIGPALRAWIKNQTEPVEVWIETLNDHVTPLYEGMVRDCLNEGQGDDDKPRHLKTFCVVFTHPGMKFDFEHTFDVGAAFKLSDVKKQHLATSYAELLKVNIGDKKENLKPIYIPDDSNPGYSFPESWYVKEERLEGMILVSMFSASCTSRDPKCNYVPNKMLPWAKWSPMLHFLRERFPNTPIKFLGAPTDEVPEHLDKDCKLVDDWDLVRDDEYMRGIPLNRLALIMKKAKLLVTIDNGMAHLGATQEVPTFLMYPIALGAHYILPIGNPNLVWQHMNPVTVNPDRLLNGLQFAVERFAATVWKEKQ